jgi:hypothetical protein
MPLFEHCFAPGVHPPMHVPETQAVFMHVAAMPH